MLAYRREIDGLRALAVVPVILFHGGVPGFGGGYVGVDVFFVISGYLIASIIFDEKEAGRFTILGFYERRARRILPALFFVILACMPFAWLWMMPSQLEAFTDSAAAVALFVSNIYFWQTSGYFGEAAELKPLLHTWSLAVEEQFYVVFPLFVLLCWRFGRGWIAAILAVGGLLALAMTQLGGNLRFGPPFLDEDLRWFNQPEWLSFYLTPSRAWELVIGVLVALYLRNRRPIDLGAPRPQLAALIGLALVAGAVVLFDQNTPFPGVTGLVPTLGTALIILYADPANWVGRLLSLGPAVGVGLISYSAYLWHQPLFAFARLRLETEPSPWIIGGLALASLGLAALTWRFVEQPFRNRSLTSRRLVFGAAAAGSAALLVVGAAGHLSEGFKGRFPAELVAALEAGERLAGDNHGCRYFKVEDYRACDFGDPESERTVLLIGNSHATILIRNLDGLLRQRGLRGLHLWAPTDCTPIPHKRAHLEDPACRRHFAFLRDYVAADPKITDLVFAHRWTAALVGNVFDNAEGGVERGYVPPLPEAEARAQSEIMGAFLADLMATGRNTVLVYPFPETGFLVPKRMFRDYVDNGRVTPEAHTTSHARFTERNRLTYELLDDLVADRGAHAVVPERFLCSVQLEGRCATVSPEGLPLYFDDDHLSDTGSRPIVEEIVRQLP